MDKNDPNTTKPEIMPGELKIRDSFGKSVTLYPKVELYSVTDFMGMEMPGLALDLYALDDNGQSLVPYATLTKSFGEFISIKDSAYIDTNNCPFADQLLEQGIAEPAGFTKNSGYCTYPLWVFNEDFLQKAGGENYQQYSKIYDEYMFGTSEDEEPDMAMEEQSGMNAEDENPAPLEIRSLAALKRAIKPGAELMATYHGNHPEIGGLVRVVTEVPTNGFYSKIKDQPDHKFSAFNHGRGFYTGYEKAARYQFEGSSIKVLDAKKNDGSPLYEFEVYEPEMKMEASEENEASLTMTMGGV